jgi:hypothetical protein
MNAMTRKVCLRLTLRILLMTTTPAAAHDHDRPALDSWFKALQSKGKAACCDGGDATRVSDADWDTVCRFVEISPGQGTSACHYRVRLEGQWVDVPDNAVIEEPNRDGRTLVWPYYVNGMPVVRCFLPGSMT